MRRKIICPERAGSNWESDEITLLTREFRKGTGLTKIALMLRRTEMEVVRLIEKMDLYRLSDCRPGRKTESPLCTGCPWKEACSGPDWREVTNLLEEYADILTVEEVCEALRIGENAAYALLGSGQFKGFRNGRSWRIPKEAVRRFILERAGLG